MANEKRKIELEASVSADTSGFQQISDAARQTAQDVKASGQDAAKGPEAIGVSAEKSAAQIERAYGRMEAEARRTAAILKAQAEGTGKAGELMNRALSQGLDPARLKAQLDQIAKYESAVRGVGTSAKETAWALRGVPAQFTDIVTSLAAGQQPLTVFMQQGGQLKDMFGGAGNAAKALGGYVLGLITPFNVAAAAVAALGVAYYKGSEEANAFAKAIILSGNAAGTSVNQLQNMQSSIANATGATKGAVADALNLIASTGKVSAEALGFVADAAIRMERVTGTAVEDTVKQFAELGKSPVEASKKLNEQYNYLTAAVYQQIKALEDQGRADEAATLAQKTYADTVVERTDKIKQNLGSLEVAWKGLGDIAKGAWDAMLGVGRTKSFEDQIKDLKEQLRTGSFDFALTEDDIKTQISSLEAQIKKTKEAADATAAKNKTEREGIAAIDAVTKANEKAMSKQEQMNKALADYRSNIEKIRAADPSSALLDTAKIAAAEKAIRDQYKERAAAVKKVADEYGPLIKSINERVAAEEAALGTSEKLTDGEKFALKVMTEMRDGTRKLTDAQKQFIAVQLERLLVSEKQNIAEAEAAKNAESAAKAREKYTDSLRDETEKLIEKAKTAEYENSLIGKSAEEIGRLTEARYNERIELLQDKAAAIEIIAGRTDEVTEIEKQIDALKRLKSAEALKPQLQAQSREWQKFTDDIERSLTDALMRSFESGDSFGKAFAKNLENTFKTMVLKVAVQAVVNGVTGGLGIGGSSSGGIGGGSLFDLAGSAYNAFSSGGMTFGLPSFSTSVENLSTAWSTFNTMTAEGVGTLDALTASLKGTGSSFATVAGYAMAAYNAAKAIDEGKWGTAIGTGVGTYFGGPVGSAIGSLVGSLVDGMFDGGGGPKSNSKFTNDPAVGGSFGGSSAELQAWVNASASAFNRIAQAYGSATRAQLLDTWLGTDPNGTAQTQLDMQITANTGQQLYLRRAQYGGQNENGGRSPEELAAAMADTLRDSILIAVERADIGTPAIVALFDSFASSLGDLSAERADALTAALTGGWLDQLLATVDEAAIGIEGVADAATRLAAVSALKPIIEAVGLSFFDLGTVLANAVGGVDNAAAALSSYYENFFSASEQFAAKSQRVQSALNSLDVGGAFDNVRAEFENLVATGTRESYRALIEAAGAVGEQSTVAALLALAPAFAEVTYGLGHVEEAAGGAADAIDSLSSTMQSLMGERSSLERQLLQLQGGDLRAFDTQGYTAAEIAAYDYNQTLRDQITVLETATAATERITSERLSIEQQILQASGNKAAIRQAELDALDESNQALQRQLYLIQDVNSALQNAGISAGSVAAVLRDGMLGRISQEDVGAQLATTLVGGIYNALAGTYAEQITTTFIDGIITPMVTAMVAGENIAAAVSQSALDAVVAQANASMQALGAVLSDPAIQAAIGSISTAVANMVGGIANIAGQPYSPPTVAEQAQSAVRESANTQIKDIAAEREQLMLKLWQLEGNTVALRQRELNALDASNRALQQQIYDLEDAKRIADERTGLERQLLQVQGDTVALRNLERAALDASNQSLYDQINALADQKAVADERAGLERQLLQLQGDTAAIRALERAALDESNRSLYDQIKALEDSQAAANGMTNAAGKFSDAWRGVTDALIAEAIRIRGVLATNSAMGYAALESRFAIATAQARAGDTRAAQNLAQYSNDLLSAAAGQVGSRLELVRLQARVAGSLEETATVLGGINPNGAATPIDTLVESNQALNQTVAELKTEIIILKQHLSDIKTNTRRSADAANGLGEAPMLVEVVV